MKAKGFTLIELMIVIVIIGVLGAIAIPHFAAMRRTTLEAMTKGNLGTIRSALSVYYSDTEGMLPSDDLTSMTAQGIYLRGIPLKSTPPYHPDGNTVSAGDISIMSITHGDWFYVNTGPLWGTVMVNCVHADLKGVIWTMY